MFRLLGVGDQLVNGLTREELVRQLDAPGSAGMDASGLKQKCEARGKCERPLRAIPSLFLPAIARSGV